MKMMISSPRAAAPQANDPLAHALLEALHPEGERFCVCRIGKSTRKVFVASAREALEAAARLTRTRGVNKGIYFGLGSLRAGLVEGRGKKADVVALRAAWADIDALDFEPLATRVVGLGGGAEGKQRAWAEATAEEKAAAFLAAEAKMRSAIDAGKLVKPSAIVHSGRGLHLYFFLAEAATGLDLTVVEAVNRGIADLIHGDDVGDRARVLRMPGTLNLKEPTTPLPCKVIRFEPERRYPLGDLRELLATFAPAKSKRQGRERKLLEDEQPTPPTFDLSGLPEVFIALVKGNRWAQLSWERKRADFKHQTRSEYAMSIANYAVEAGLTDESEILRVIDRAPSTWSAKGSYVRDKPAAALRTVKKALASFMARGSRPRAQRESPHRKIFMAAIKMHMAGHASFSRKALYETTPWLGWNAALSCIREMLMLGIFTLVKLPKKQPQLALVPGQHRLPDGNEVLVKEAILANPTSTGEQAAEDHPRTCTSSFPPACTERKASSRLSPPPCGCPYSWEEVRREGDVHRHDARGTRPIDVSHAPSAQPDAPAPQPPAQLPPAQPSFD